MRGLNHALIPVAALAIACAPVPPRAPLSSGSAAVSTAGEASRPEEVGRPGEAGRPSEAGLHARPFASGLVAGSRAEAMGTLRISVRWPRRVEALPLSSDLITVSITSSTGAPVASASLTPSSGPESTVNFQLPASDDLTIAAKAFQATTLLASGSATASILANQLTPLNLTLRPLFVPTVAKVTPNAGPNALVDIGGSNFGLSRGLRPPVVLFGDATSSRVLLDSDSSLRAQVPADLASASAVVVVVDGVPSEPSTAMFTRLTALNAISPASPTLSLGATASISVTGVTATGGEPAPTVQWVVFVPPSAPIPVTLSGATGSVVVLMAVKAGTATIIVQSGDLSKSTTVTVQ